MYNLDEVYTEEYEKQFVNYNILALQKFLNKLNNDDDWQNPHTYYITEYNPKETDDLDTYTPNKYKLINLKIDSIEDGIILFIDAEGILDETMRKNTPLPLQAIIIDNIIMIGHTGRVFTISTIYGYIKIEY